ncbi:Uncharacterised protein [Vibrio cholerae]|nr:Uncharacterised protein [Vibrio cholerae]CSI29483.1 Uncharacterised protein [Vibrio cholerae]
MRCLAVNLVPSKQSATQTGSLREDKRERASARCADLAGARFQRPWYETGAADTQSQSWSARYESIRSASLGLGKCWPQLLKALIHRYATPDTR